MYKGGSLGISNQQLCKYYFVLSQVGINEQFIHSADGELLLFSDVRRQSVHPSLNFFFKTTSRLPKLHISDFMYVDSEKTIVVYLGR